MTVQSEKSDRLPSRSFANVAVRGAVTTGLSQIVKVLASILSVVLIARLVSPDDYGVIAMVSPLAGFLLVFQNMGLNHAVVQAPNLSDEQTNALFWYNMGASSVIALLMVLLSPAVYAFYDDIRPAYVTTATALTILVAGCKQQHSALLNRQMQFVALSATDTVSAVGTLIFTLAFALWLRNYWALWLGTFLGTALNTAIVWKISPWRPSLKISFAGTGGMLTFGANLTAFNLVNFFSRNLDNVLIAKYWGASEVGLYDRSYKLMMFPLANINYPLSRVMLPAMSKVQDQPDRYRRMFLLAITALSLMSVPGIMAAAIVSDKLVPLLLGRQWTAAVPIFTWLSLAAIVQPITNATGWLFISSGRTREMMLWGMVASPIVIVSFVVGLPWGASGVAAAYFVSQVILLPPGFYWCTRNSAVRAFDLYVAMAPSLAGGLASWLTLRPLRETMSDVPLILTALVLCYGMSVGFQLLTKNGRRTVGTIFALCIGALPKRAKWLRRE